MKRGDIVTTYFDPMTEKNPEGKAKLLKIILDMGPWEKDRAERWEVQLDNGDIVDRNIRVKV